MVLTKSEWMERITIILVELSSTMSSFSNTASERVGESTTLNCREIHPSTFAAERRTSRDVPGGTVYGHLYDEVRERNDNPNFVEEKPYTFIKNIKT